MVAVWPDRWEQIENVAPAPALAFAISSDDNARLLAEHTIVPPEIAGRGVAAALVHALISDAREHEFKIEPQCSYVSAAFKRHPDWSDVMAGEQETERDLSAHRCNCSNFSSSNRLFWKLG